MLLWTIVGLVLAFLVLNIAWRYASRRWTLPCPSLLAWALDDSKFGWILATERTLDRIDLKPGMRVLEIGPGPGRLLLPAAKRVWPTGLAVGVEIQEKMLERLRRSAQARGIENIQCIHGDASRPHVEPASFDRVFLCTVLGEIPARLEALKQCHRALKDGGLLSITENMFDPHYQRLAVVNSLAEKAGFVPDRVFSDWRMFTANFRRPSNLETATSIPGREGGEV